MEATTTVPRACAPSASRAGVKPRALALTADAAHLLRSSGAVRVTRPVATKAPRWARGALKVINPRSEFWWADSADAARACRVEDPFRCPWGGEGQALSIEGAPAVLANVSVERAPGAGFQWALELRIAG